MTVGVLTKVIRERGAPRIIWVDNGGKFTSVVMGQWAYWNGVTLNSTRP